MIQIPRKKSGRTELEAGIKILASFIYVLPVQSMIRSMAMSFAIYQHHSNCRAGPGPQLDSAESDRPAAAAARPLPVSDPALTARIRQPSQSAGKMSLIKTVSYVFQIPCPSRLPRLRVGKLELGCPAAAKIIST
jgi:hypothetical protein